MDAFQDRVAVITGGAGGIGRALADAFAARGARVVLADIDDASLAHAEKELSSRGARVLAVNTDVTHRESVNALAERTWSHFGAAHIVCNNAGIAVLGELVQATPEDWDLTMAINFWGVVHGVNAFVPRLIEQGQGGHVLNTASMAGLVGMQGLGIYCASKFAVVGLSESLHRECRAHDIGVSILCPMIVATQIGENSRRVLGRPPLVSGGSGSPPAAMKGGVIAAEEAARRALRGIERRDLYILTHPEQREILRRRAELQDSMFNDALWML